MIKTVVRIASIVGSAALVSPLVYWILRESGNEYLGCGTFAFVVGSALGCIAGLLIVRRRENP